MEVDSIKAFQLKPAYLAIKRKVDDTLFPFIFHLPTSRTDSILHSFRNRAMEPMPCLSTSISRHFSIARDGPRHSRPVRRFQISIVLHSRSHPSLSTVLFKYQKPELKACSQHLKAPSLWLLEILELNGLWWLILVRIMKKRSSIPSTGPSPLAFGSLR